jgi:hypothetical protein
MIMLLINDLFNNFLIMLPIDFKTWTRDQWIEFDWYKNSIFKQTPEELQQQKEYYIQNIITQTKNILNTYNIVFTWNETDFTQLWTSYINWWPNFFKNPAMNEWLWNNDILQEIIIEKITNNNNLIDFCNFVIQYEF